MKGEPRFATPERHRGRATAVLLEAVGIAVTGLLLALLVNQYSPRGLVLTRDYFPKGDAPRLASVPRSATNVTPATTNTASPGLTNALEARLRAKNLGMVDTAQAEALFQDPRYAQELVVFVDARDDRHYAGGHVPGAFQLDHFYPERYLATVLPVTTLAEQVVVYCNGGDCEDSEFSALLLREAGVANDRLLVYVGGMTAWKEKGLPVELGERNSGQMATPPP
jgi:rhodanese-related sulfurtransferase